MSMDIKNIEIHQIQMVEPIKLKKMFETVFYNTETRVHLYLSKNEGKTGKDNMDKNKREGRYKTQAIKKVKKHIVKQ